MRRTRAHSPRPPIGACLRIARAALLVTAAACWGCGRGEDGGQLYRRPEHRLLVVGWDGATFELIDPLLEAGRLPNLRRLIEGGVQAELASTIVPISSAAWTTAVTGKGPGQTGVYAFFEPVEGSYGARLISSRSNRAAPIWRMLTGRGFRVNVVGVPVTYPPEPVFGTMIAGMLSPFDGAYAFPQELTDQLRSRGFVPDLGVWRDPKELTSERVEEQLRIKEEVVLDLLRRDDWAFSMIVFKSLDVLSHRAYDGRPDSGVANLLVRLDAILGRMLEAVGPGANVVVMSDHGFATYHRGFNLHRWLVAEGLSVLAEDGGEGASDGRPANLAEQRELEHRRRLGELDMSRTRAYATTCEGNFGSLRLNLGGREPRGIVGPEDADSVLADVERRLRAIPSDPSGDPPAAPLVTGVFRGDDLYPGPERRKVPDLLFEVRPQVQCLASLGPRVFRDYPRPVPDHARMGILVLSGPRVAAAPGRGRADLFDVAPTLLHLLDQPIHSEMPGGVLSSFLRPGEEPRVIPEAEDPALAGWKALDDPYSAETLEEIEQRLRKLGYGG